MLLWIFTFNEYPLLKSENTKTKTQGGWKEEAMDSLWLKAAASQMHVNISQTSVFI